MEHALYRCMASQNAHNNLLCTLSLFYRWEDFTDRRPGKLSNAHKTGGWDLNYSLDILTSLLAPSLPPGTSKEVSNSLIHAVRDPGLALLMKELKQNTRSGFPYQALGAASLQRTCSLGNKSKALINPILKNRLSIGQGTRLRACCCHPHLPQNYPGHKPPGSMCTQHPPSPWRTLSCSPRAVVPISRHNYHWLLSCQSTEPRNNMLCDMSHPPSDPGQAHASLQAPAASGSYSRKKRLFPPVRERLSHLH